MRDERNYLEILLTGVTICLTIYFIISCMGGALIW